MALWLYLASYAAGLASAPYLFYFTYFPVLAGLCALACLLRPQSVCSRPALPLFFWLLGCCLYHMAMTPPQGADQALRFVGKTPVIVEGRVLSGSGRSGGGMTIDLAAEQILQAQTTYSVTGNIRLFIDEGEPAVVPGDRIRFRSRLREPRLYGTPGEFDYPRHLAYQDIFVTAFLADGRDLVVFADRPQGFFSRIARLRTYIGRRIDAAVSPDFAPLVRALVIGDQSGLSEEQRELLARGGVSHLFAISGLHLGLVATFLFVIARALYRRAERLLLWAPPMRVLPLLLLPLLLIYLWLTGNAISTCRAFVMTAVAVILLAGGRSLPPLKLLASCALVFLLAEPLILFQPAFQLSFAGLFGILLWLPAWQPRLPQRPRLLRYLSGLMLSTIAATLATTPLVLTDFHLWAPAGLAANLLAIPAVAFGAVPMGLGGALLMPLWDRGATWLLQGCAWIIQLSLSGVEQILRIPGLGGRHVYASPHELLAVGLVCVVLLLLLIPNQGKRSRLWRGVAVGSAAMILLAFIGKPAGMTVTALSVGQGDAILLSFAEGRHFLIDGGGSFSRRFDIGERLVAPALGSLGVDALDAVVLTHNHPDHYRGLIRILRDYPTGEFWTPVPVARLDPELRKVLHDRRIPIVHPAPGWTSPNTAAGVPLWLFTPDQTTADLNDRSLAVLAGYGEDGVLLTGDLEEHGVAQLLSAPLPHAVNLLKLPHHGSRKCRPEQLLDRVAPELAFVSLGVDNPHGFPHPAIVRALRSRRIALWRTDLQGSLRFCSEGRGWLATHWNHRMFR